MGCGDTQPQPQRCLSRHSALVPRFDLRLPRLFLYYYFSLQSSTHIILSLETRWETVQQHFSPANRITMYHNYRMMVKYIRYIVYIIVFTGRYKIHIYCVYIRTMKAAEGKKINKSLPNETTRRFTFTLHRHNSWVPPDTSIIVLSSPFNPWDDYYYCAGTSTTVMVFEWIEKKI